MMPLHFMTTLDKMMESGEGIEELADLWQEKMDLINQSKEIYAGILLETQQYAEDETAALTEHFKQSQEDWDNHYQYVVTASEDGINDLIDAIDTMSPEVATATEGMITNATDSAYTALGMKAAGAQSSVFYELGKSMISSLVKGITDTGGDVADALSTAMQSAADSIDISGITSRINNKLGESMSRAQQR